MNLLREVGKAVRVTLLLWVLVAVIYPVLILVVGQIALPNQANGSLVKNAQGQVIGSRLIGQPFTSARYFNSRPSTTNYSSANPQKDPTGILKTGISGASNFAPSNPDLLKRIQATINQRPKTSGKPSADLVYTSGSSLDPHIAIAAAQAQVARIAAARNLKPNQVENLINTHIDGRFLGIFGEPGVNVLQLNLALDALQA
jgi:potassium-transporting ATPase KdpC subunit